MADYRTITDDLEGSAASLNNLKHIVGVQSFNPETLRIVAYINFYIMVLIAMIVTKLTVEEDLITNSPLVKTFGYNNICINWDYRPAMWITAMIYPIVEFPLLGYIALNWLRTKKAFDQQVISHRHYVLSTVFSAIEFVLFAWFRMIFVNRAFETVAGHTAPFTGFQVALAMNAIQNLLYYGYGGYGAGVFSDRERFWGKIYIVIVVIISLIKQTISWLAICKANDAASFCDTLALDVSKESSRFVAEFFDRCWFVFLAVIPLFLSWRVRSRASPLDFRVTLCTLPEESK